MEARMDIWSGLTFGAALGAWYALADMWATRRIIGAERAFHQALENLAAPNDTVTARVCDRDGRVIRHIYWSRKQAATMSPRTYRDPRI
jgi:hypothetical protein